MALTVNIFDNESKRKNHQSLQLMASNVFLMPFNYGTRCQRPLHTHQSCARSGEVDTLPEEEQGVLIKIISAYVRDYRAKQVYAS